MKKSTFYTIIILIVLASISFTAITENKKEAEIDSLHTQIETMMDDHQADKEILLDLFMQVEYNDEPVYVIGHKSPDFDTTASAIGMAYLLNELGIEAEAKIAGPLNLETEYGLSAIGYPAPEILEDATDKQLWLVDHSVHQQMVDGADKARIVGITDHHGIGNIEIAEPINVLSCPTGSTSALVFALCEKCDIKITQDIAEVLLSGMLSDTANMKGKDVTVLDEIAFDRLKTLSGISDTDALFNGMLEAKLSYKGMDDQEIYYSDYKEYKTNGFLYGIGVIKVAHPEQIPAMSQRMLDVIENEVNNGSDMDFLLLEVYDADYSLGYTGFYGKDMEFTEETMNAIFSSLGEKRGNFFASSPSLSRKTDVLPPMDSYLNALEH